MTDRKRNSLKWKLQSSRYRLLTSAPELAYPLVDMLFVAIRDVFHISTNGSCIYFDAAWLDRLSPRALDYALLHQLMHLRLDHMSRPQLFRGDRYHYACNIIVNSHLVDYGFVEDKLPGIGQLQRDTLFPRVPGRTVTPTEAYRMTPLDPAELAPNRRGQIITDSDSWWDRPDDRGEEGIIVLSPKDKDPEGLIPSERIRGRIEYCRQNRKKKLHPEKLPIMQEEADDPDDFQLDYIESPRLDVKELVTTLQNIKARDDDGSHGELMTERIIRRIHVIPKDWRAILNHFIMDATHDYDFTPPDRRMQELDFFLPDFNESSTPRLNVLFMVDISGSIRENEVAMAVAEICAAMEQFGGMLQGSIGFFDTMVRRVFPIRQSEDLWSMVPGEGGGTDFGCIFHYVKAHMADDPPSEIVIMTDGRSDFPDYSETMDIPVLWLLTNDRVRIPWGQATYFRSR